MPGNPRYHRRVGSRTSLAATLACTALVAGCGGDSDGDATSDTGPLTVAEYREQGNALCKEAVREAEAIPVPRSPDDIADYLKTVFDASSELTDEFAEFEPPEELRADHERAVELSRESDETLDGIVERVRDASDPQAAAQREFRKLAPELERAEKLNNRLGLEECNETGPPAEQPAPS